MLMVGEEIFYHGNLWDQVRLKTPAAAGEEQAQLTWGTGGTRGDTLALCWSQPSQHLLFCWFLWISLIHVHKCTIKMLLQH